MIPRRANTNPHDDPGVAALESLVDEIAGGSQSAMSALYDRLAPSVLAVCQRVLHKREPAEEATMDAFLQVWRSAGQYQPERGTVTSWILTMARTRALDRLRAEAKQAPAVTLAEDGGVDRRPTAPSTPDNSAVEGERRSRVRTALDRVSPNERSVLEHAFYGGMSHTQIAAHSGLPLGTVKTQIRSGMIKLRQVLGAAGLDHEG